MLLDLRDIGVLPPLGVYDPLGLIETRDMRRSKSRSARIVNSRMKSFLRCSDALQLLQSF